jgi:NAD(P)-dependent dehydrogenase (short-subunit alcohol dehydrogenase family)
VTGGRGEIGAAIVSALGERDVVVLDLPDFDVGEPEAWRSLEGEFDAAFLNAGTDTGRADPADLSDEEWHRILRANLEGVVYGTRELAARLMRGSGSIVATASLAGLTGMPGDPAYTATKHAVVGWARAAAPALEGRRSRLNALAPGFTDTPLVDADMREVLDVPLIEPSFVAEAALRVLEDAETGRAWVVQPNRVVPFRFPGVPGPR